MPEPFDRPWSQAVRDFPPQRGESPFEWARRIYGESDCGMIGFCAATALMIEREKRDAAT
jgi:hypothetical protein